MGFLDDFRDDEDIPTPKPQPPENPRKIIGGVVDASLIVGLVRRIPGLRLVPVTREKIPLEKGFTSPEYWNAHVMGSIEDRIGSWFEWYGNPNFAFALGDKCGTGGDLVVEADNDAGEEWAQEHLPPTGIMTGARNGKIHRHYQPDIIDEVMGTYRGNRTDVLRSRRTWKRLALENGYRIELPRDERRIPNEDELSRMAEEVVRAERDIPMGPILDIKSVGGQCVTPHSVHVSGHVYTEVQPWTVEAWSTRPTFTPGWFPKLAWASDAPVAVGGRGGQYDGSYWTMDKREKRAMAYVARCRAAVAKQGAHDALFSVARIVCVGFDLDIPTARRVLVHYAKTVCANDPWTDQEIEHKLKEGYKSNKPVGHMLVDQRRGNRSVAQSMELIEKQLAKAIARARTQDDFGERPIFEPEMDDDESKQKTKLTLVLSPETALTPDLIEDDEEPIGPTAAAPVTTIMVAGAVSEQQADDDAQVRRVFEEFKIDFEEITKEGDGYNLRHNSEGVVTLPPQSQNIAIVLTYSKPYKGKIRMNSISYEIEHNGSSIDEVFIKSHMDVLFKGDIPMDKIRHGIQYAATKNKYDPVRDWISGLPKWDGVNRLDDMHIFAGCDPADAWAQVCVRKFVLALLARALRPGCKNDQVLILKGGQGLFKSTFLENVVPSRFFTSQAVNTRDRDGMMTLARNWLVEFGELEHVVRVENVLAIKAFLSQRVDEYRKPYGREPVKIPRRFVCAGTTNEHEILFDATGDRRFNIVRLAKPTQRDWMLANREQVFAQALPLINAHFVDSDAGNKETANFLEGQWWTTPEEDSIRSHYNAGHRKSDPWETKVAQHIDQYGHEPFMVVDILTTSLAMDESRIGRNEQIRITNILMGFNCERLNDGRPTRYKARQGRFWARPKSWGRFVESIPVIKSTGEGHDDGDD